MFGSQVTTIPATRSACDATRSAGTPFSAEASDDSADPEPDDIHLQTSGPAIRVLMPMRGRACRIGTHPGTALTAREDAPSLDHRRARLLAVACARGGEHEQRADRSPSPSRN